MENIIEYLIPLIFILAYVFPKAFKKKGAKDKPTPAKAKQKSPGLFSKLNKMLEEMHEKEQEAARQERQRVDDYEWPVESYRDDDEDEDEEPTRASEDTPQEAPQPVSEAEPVSSRPSEETRAASPGPLPLPTAGPSRRYVPANISNKELRQAIVWSEILAPPKALRDD